MVAKAYKNNKLDFKSKEISKMHVNKPLVIAGLIGSVLFLSACDETSNNTEKLSNEPVESNEEELNSEVTEESSESDQLSNDGFTVEDLKNSIINSSDILSLVNKNYSLEDDYVPDDLVTLDVPTVLENPEINQLRKEAADALKEMINSAEEENIDLYARSGYRSYQTQVQLFNNYVANNGEEAANKFSARPGESEHQTGLSIDVTSESVDYQLTESFGETAEGIWIQEQAHNFGFIIRYPEGKEEITGYQYEPWHLRYLGKEMATEVFESGLTYEEFLVERGIDIEI